MQMKRVEGTTIISHEDQKLLTGPTEKRISVHFSGKIRLLTTLFRYWQDTQRKIESFHLIGFESWLINNLLFHTNLEVSLKNGREKTQTYGVPCPTCLPDPVILHI